MDKLNRELVEYLPPGIKITLDQLPLPNYSLLISVFLSVLGFAFLVLALRWKPTQKVKQH